MEQTCSRAETEISKISLQQREMVITVDQGIKLLPCGFPMYTVRVNRFHLSLDFPFPPFFYSSLIVCLPVSSSPRNSIQEETKSSDSHTSSYIRHHHLFSAPCLTSVAPHLCFSVMSVWLRPYVALSHTVDTTDTLSQSYYIPTWTQNDLLSYNCSGYFT